VRGVARLVGKMDKGSAGVASFVISAILHEVVVAMTFGAMPPFLGLVMVLQSMHTSDCSLASWKLSCLLQLA
jgi:hypothetical protein